ncbi:hypothetical protein OsJ_32988 [Oryza sativa Japonica Group]|uniref:Uncharacterized protein n=1 Tax=Oryza sativa subsp. japonica TaxID=39947 RepID=B9G9F7_ORYSJ|nr:hypothetical protein OsJ_32988 [Oryza sativa Japonica Group]
MGRGDTAAMGRRRDENRSSRRCGGHGEMPLQWAAVADGKWSRCRRRDGKRSRRHHPLDADPTASWTNLYLQISDNFHRPIELNEWLRFGTCWYRGTCWMGAML